ncbi:Conserved TM helix repeat-containing protein [Gloeocapsa sp. PCC 7428]|uniref:mechanosensitive ion channel n=1 Tax=Gloeocapsa sp. PCC 7428 TaxID=1173026 RepID=UPI0002A60C91|nr:mechanosensitive ion channel [Gloeocapsa sp. PCC 7428]AFZ30738.1 Conserved TM helix repeat-containing protein [Gloeocapsa sp. PCC 7428]
MNGTWQGIATIGLKVPILGDAILAQFQQQAPAGQPLQQTGQAIQSTVDYSAGLLAGLWSFLPNLLAALLVLIVGWIIAAIAKSIIKGLLSRTNLDNRIAAGVVGRGDSGDLPRVENLIGNIVFWIIILFTAVAVLQTLNLQAVSQPLNNFLNLVLGFIPRIIGAAILFGVAWLIATIVKLITTRGLQALRLDERLDQRSPDEPRESNRMSLSETIGNALYWFIFLLFLIPVLDTLGLQQALLPVQNLVNEILLILPNILAAVLIAAAGWLLATVVRRIVTNLLASTGVDQMGERFGLGRTRTSTSTQSLSGIIGTIVYVLILIPVAIAALNALRINAISVPAIAMLQQILNALPAIFTAALILILGYFLGRFVADLVTNILSSLGFDNIFSVIGLSGLQRRRVPSDIRRTEEVFVIPPPGSDQETVLQPERTTAENAAAAISTRTPSEVVGIITLVGIMLFATVAAVNILNIPALTALVSGLIVIFGRILAGLIVFAIGLFLANLAYSLIVSSSSNRQAQLLGQVARIAIIVFVSALALQQIGIATEIVNLAFGLLLGAVAVAVAIAFGLGGRDIAAQQVRNLLSSFQEQRNQPPR